MNYFDILLAKKLEDDRDPKVEGLSVTENGRYHEDGVVYDPVIVEVPEPTLISKNITANGNYSASSDNADGYSSVSVDVPLPSNAYLLQTKEHESIATFDDGTDNFVKSLEVAIEPQQDLHGYDAPWVGGAGKNKCSQKITEFSYSNNVGGSSTVQGDTLVITTTSSLNSGVYSILDFVESFTGKCSYSVDVKANTNGDVLIGMTNAGRKTVSLTTSWQRIKFEDVTFDGNSKTFVIYSQGTANSIQVKDFMFELGSVAHDYEPYSNICPISGWDEVNVTRTGKNLWGGEKLADDIVSKVPNATKDTTNKTVTYEASDIKDVILFDKFKPNTQYSFFLSTESFYTNIAIIYTDETWEPTIPNQMCVSDASKTVARLVGIQSLGTTDLKYDECGVFEGVITAQDFEPYNGNTYTIDLDGTRYGGKLDVINGVLTLDRAYLTIDDFSSFGGSGTSAGGLHWFDVRNKPKGKVGNKNICSSCGYMENGWTSTITVMSVDINDTIPVRIYDSSESLSDFKDKYPNLQVVYELATPLTIQLSPTIIKSLQGQNNFFTNTGEVIKLEYFGKEQN